MEFYVKRYVTKDTGVSEGDLTDAIFEHPRLFWIRQCLLSRSVLHKNENTFQSSHCSIYKPKNTALDLKFRGEKQLAMFGCILLLKIILCYNGV